MGCNSSKGHPGTAAALDPAGSRLLGLKHFLGVLGLYRVEGFVRDGLCRNCIPIWVSVSFCNSFLGLTPSSLMLWLGALRDERDAPRWMTRGFRVKGFRV